MTILLSTKEAARFLNVNEKMVYTLIAEKGLPATKITGKWTFPKHLIEQWLELNTINPPQPAQADQNYDNLLIITGSNDLLLDSTIALYNKLYPDQIAVFGNLGSMGGIQALQRNQCHMAASHLLQENTQEYNFKFAESELEHGPALVNFCSREQGLLLPKGNPKAIQSVADLGEQNLRIVNRSMGTGTRLLLDYELKKAAIDPSRLKGYDQEKPGHMDVGLDILSGKADAAPGIRIVAHLLELDFLPLRWERFDLLIPKERFFEKKVQRFLGLLHDDRFKNLYPPGSGYDLALSGTVVFPSE